MILQNQRFHWLSNIECHECTRVDIVEDQITGKQYILKSIRKDAAIYVHQFHKEVDTLSMLHHPYMPEIVDVFEEPSTYCLVETYIKGMSLKKWISKHPIWFQIMKYRIFYECMNRIEYLHSLHILYIDFKLDNLLIDKGHVYLIDFNSCIAYGNRQVMLASRSNLAYEYQNYEEKDYTSDIYGIGNVCKSWFPTGFLRLFFKKCIQKNPSKRFISIQKMKRAFLGLCLCRILSVLILVFLSVYIFFQNQVESDALHVYLNRKDVSTFMNAYTYTLNKQEGDPIEKIQSNLYLWIENDWFTIPIINSSYSSFLLRQAIQSQNEVYCTYFIERMDTNSLDANLHLILFTEADTISYAHIQDYLEEIETHKLSYNDEIDSMNTLLTILLNRQIVLEKNDRDRFFQLHASYRKPCEKMEDTIYKFLEYYLFLQNQGIEIPSIPPYYEESFQDNEKIQLLIQYTRRSI